MRTDREPRRGAAHTPIDSEPRRGAAETAKGRLTKEATECR